MQKIKERLAEQYRSMTGIGRYSLLTTMTTVMFLLMLSALLTVLSAIMGNFEIMRGTISQSASCALRCAAAGFPTALIGDRMLRQK